jgi:hypothetical protein
MAAFDDDLSHSGTLTWPERIEKYRQTIDIPCLRHENGWTYGT